MPAWKSSLKKFFDHRAFQVQHSEPTLNELCFICGRDPRIWGNEERAADLIDNIMTNLNIDSSSTVLEVGAGSGYIAKFLSRKVNQYTGVDISKSSLEVAKKLKIANAEFKVADGANLPFPDNFFSAVICQDVFTNFPDLAFGKKIIQEMLRTVRTGGKVMIGSVLNKEYEEEGKRVFYESSVELDKQYRPLDQRKYNLSVWDKVLNFLSKEYQAQGQITCYFFSKEEFIELYKELNAEVEITEVHPLNPHPKFRFNVIFTKV